MNYRIVLLLGKIWIIAALIKSVFTFWMIGFSNRVWLSIVMLILHILVGTSICIYASKRMSNEQTKLIPISNTLIHPFFQIVKWSTIVALGFQLIAAIVIAFFYCLNEEFEATLIGVIILGIATVAIVKAVEYFKDYKN